MNDWTKRLFAVAAPLLLTGCLWGPGKFTSDLALRKDGSFVLDYRGEIILETADAMSKPAWQNNMAHCASTEGKERPCSAAEIADQKTEYEKKRQSDEDAAKSFGLPGTDDESNRAFAAKLMKYAGWRSVTYRSKGVFDVDYHVEGRLTQDFVFPMMPDSSIIIPFIALRRRTDGAALVNAPALTGGANMFGPMAEQMSGDSKQSLPSRAQGRFTVHTDGQIMTNNSDDGPSTDPLGQQVHWDIVPGSTKVPETLIRL
jgi:hypothetical protein